jgi:hypothetical protein
MESLGNILETKTSKSSNSIFVCELCHYNCCKKFNWDRHILSAKHIKETNGTSLETKHEQNEQIKEFVCENCNKEFKTRSGLWKHKKKCDCDENKQSNNTVSTTDMNNPVLLEKMFAMFTQMMTQNQDFMTNVIGKVQGNNNNHTNSHNTNNQFNIQMFLNEHCKNAMNLSDFIKSLPLTVQQYENTKDKGLTDTLMNMMVDGLNNLDVIERPIHCTDQKRKVMYVKDNDKWEKDTKGCDIILKNMKELSYIHKKNVKLWQDKNPNFDTIEALQIAFCDICTNIFVNITDERKNVSKLMKGLSDATYLDDDTKSEYSTYGTLASV